MTDIPVNSEVAQSHFDPEYFLPEDLREQVNLLRQQDDPDRRKMGIVSIRQEMYRRAFYAGREALLLCEEQPELSISDIEARVENDLHLSQKQNVFIREVVRLAQEDWQLTAAVLTTVRDNKELLRVYPQFKSRFDETALRDWGDEVMGTALFAMATGHFPHGEVMYSSRSLRIELEVHNQDDVQIIYGKKGVGGMFVRRFSFHKNHGADDDQLEAPLLVVSPGGDSLADFEAWTHEDEHQVTETIMQALVNVGEDPEYVRNVAAMTQMIDEIESLAHADGMMTPDGTVLSRQVIQNRFDQLRAILLNRVKGELLSEFRAKGDFSYAQKLLLEPVYDYLYGALLGQWGSESVLGPWVMAERKKYWDTILEQAKTVGYSYEGLRVVGSNADKNAFIGVVKMKPFDQWARELGKIFPRELGLLQRIGTVYAHIRGLSGNEQSKGIVIRELRANGQDLVRRMKRGENIEWKTVQLLN